MHDNKVRLSRDVIEKAEQIAAEWGLKNARAAVEAVFRRYSDDYLYARTPQFSAGTPAMSARPMPSARTSASNAPTCEALDELDDLIGA